MKYLKLLAGSFLVLSMLMASACSSDDEDILNPPLTGDAAVLAALQEYVVPVVTLSNQVAFYLASVPLAKVVPPCTPITGVCDSGILESCPGEPPELQFDQCAVEGYIFDGTIQVIPGVGVYTLSFVDFSIDNLTMTGPVNFDTTSYPPCVDEDFDSVMVTVDGDLGNLDGFLTACQDSEYPEGYLVLIVPGPDGAPLTLSITAPHPQAQHPGEILVVIEDATQSLLGTCTAVLGDSPTISCIWE